MIRHKTYFTDLAFVISNGIVWVTLSLGIMLAGFMMPFMKIQNNILLSIYAASALLSLFVGMTIYEKLSSKVEKRLLILVGLLIYGFASIVSIIVIDNIWWLILLRLIAGFGLSSLLVIVPGFVSENLSQLDKSRTMYYFDLFWPLGFCIGCILVWLILIKTIASPSIIYLCSGILSFIGFFLIVYWQNSRVSNAIGDADNHLELQLSKDTEKEAPISSNALRKGAILNYAWILMNFIYYSMFLWAPLLLTARYNNQALLAFGLIGFGLTQLPSQALGNFLLSKISSIKLFLISMAICIGCLLFISLFSTSSITVFAWIIFASTNMFGWASLYPLTDLISPSRHVSEKAQLFGKLAAVLSPIVFAFLVTLTRSMDFAIIGISIVCLFLLGIIIFQHNRR